VTFSERLHARSVAANTCLCVGLDPDPNRLPDSLEGSLPDRVTEFCKAIVAATSEHAAAFKLNLAFFEALGADAVPVLQSVTAAIPSEVLTIADAKRGDIGNSARFYASAILDDLNFDSITVAPYMGADSVLPFLEYPGKGAFVLARTSNPGGNDFQRLESGGLMLYQHVARACMEWQDQAAGVVGLVVGASDIAALRKLRVECPHAPFLVPGVGAQGGTATDVMEANGAGPILVNSSRGILYAGSGLDYPDAAAEAAQKLKNELNAARERSAEGVR